MKVLLVMLFVGICAVALRMPEVAGALGTIPLSASAQRSAEPAVEQKPMSAEELLELSKTDPHAVQKYLDSHTRPSERTEVDKLMNLLSHGKYN